MYFSVDVKEQEIKKVIEDAEEIISELNYTSEMVVKEIEEKLSSLRKELKTINNTTVSMAAADNRETAAASAVPGLPPIKRKRITNDNVEKNKGVDGKFSQKQQTVFNYASQGMSVTEIAKQMNMGQGEVMLILSLKNEVE